MATCNRTALYRHPDGYSVQVNEGDHLDDDHPLVRRFPEAFDHPQVEQATAAPGERRARRKRVR